MERVSVQPRERFEDLLVQEGVNYQGIDGSYWFEDRAYALTPEESERLHQAAEKAWSILLETLACVIATNRLSELGIPELYHDLIRHSWETRDPSLFTRLDLACDRDGAIRLLECNGDTPITLLESGIIQERWRAAVCPTNRQWNQLETSLSRRFQELLKDRSRIHFLVADGAIEELDNLQYLRRIALSEGIQSQALTHRQLFCDAASGQIVNAETGEPLDTIVKLYPWEWLLEDTFTNHHHLTTLTFFEPAWKIPLCSKGILAIAWELFPSESVLLPTYLDTPRSMKSFVAKPLFGRKGDSLALINDQRIEIDHQGSYAGQQRVYQEFVHVPVFDAWRVTLGAWIVGDTPCGISVRESREVLMRSESICVPHYIL